MAPVEGQRRRDHCCVVDMSGTGKPRPGVTVRAATVGVAIVDVAGYGAAGQPLSTVQIYLDSGDLRDLSAMLAKAADRQDKDDERGTEPKWTMTIRWADYSGAADEIPGTRVTEGGGLG